LAQFGQKMDFRNRCNARRLRRDRVTSIFYVWIDVGWNATGQILPYIFIASESILGVAIAGLSVDLAIRNDWLKAMK
jgi:hypothetical protein